MSSSPGENRAEAQARCSELQKQLDAEVEYNRKGIQERNKLVEQVLVRTTRIAELTSEKSTLEKAGLEKDDTIRGLVEEKNERADRMANVSPGVKGSQQALLAEMKTALEQSEQARAAAEQSLDDEKATNKGLFVTVERKDATIGDLEKQVADLLAQRNAANAKVAALQSELAVMSEERVMKEQQIKGYKTKVEELMEYRAEFAASHREDQSSNDQLKAENEKLFDEVVHLRAFKEQFRDLNGDEDGDELSQHILGQQNEISQLKDVCDSETAAKEKALTEKKDMSAQLMVHSQNVVELVNENTQLSQIVEHRGKVVDQLKEEKIILQAKFKQFFKLYPHAMSTFEHLLSSHGAGGELDSLS